MTGEITLSGRVLAVGGIKEKVLAARRIGIKEIILPRNNGRNLKEDIPEPILQELTFHLVSTIEEALQIALPGGGKPEKETKGELEAKVPSS